MLKTLLVLLISNIGLSYSYPFNSTYCVECIKKINYIQHNNNSINTVNDIEKDIISFCDYYNISGCEVKTKKGKEWLYQSPELICRDLDFCDYLSYDNMILDLVNYDINNQKIYRYYDLLLLLQEDISLDKNIVNHSKIWSLKIDEPYKSVSVLTNRNTTFYSCLYYGCSGSKPTPENSSPYSSILKVTTTNLLYYVNITTGNILYKTNINNIKSSYKHLGDMEGNIPYIPGIQPYNNTFYDSIYNGSLYTTIIHENYEISMCNETVLKSPCLNFVDLDITINELTSIFPTEKPRCGQALEMYCPKNFLNREDCLACVIKNQNIFTVCSIKEEEDWCDFRINIMDN